MKTIETIATVTKDGKITAQLPLDIPEGEHQVVIVIDEKLLTQGTEKKEKKAPLKFSAYPVGLVSESLTFRREDLYTKDYRTYAISLKLLFLRVLCASVVRYSVTLA